MTLPTNTDSEIKEVVSKAFGLKGNEWLDPFNYENRTYLIQELSALKHQWQLEAALDEALRADRIVGFFPDYEKMKHATLARIDDIESGLYIGSAALTNPDTTKEKEDE